MPKTLFVSPLGTFVSNVLQQGDCNGPSSWQRLMTFVFREQIGEQVWVYLDDIYIFTSTIEQHEDSLKYVLDCLKREHLYISPAKFKPYAIRFNCLGHYRDKNRLHASADKLESIRKWPTTRHIPRRTTIPGTRRIYIKIPPQCISIHNAAIRNML